MSFGAPSIPKPPPPANAPIKADIGSAPLTNPGQAQAAASLISTGGMGVTSRPNTKRSTLLGG